MTCFASRLIILLILLGSLCASCGSAYREFYYEPIDEYRVKIYHQFLPLTKFKIVGQTGKITKTYSFPDTLDAYVFNLKDIRFIMFKNGKEWSYVNRSMIDNSY